MRSRRSSHVKLVALSLAGLLLLTACVSRFSPPPETATPPARITASAVPTLSATTAARGVTPASTPSSAAATPSSTAGPTTASPRSTPAPAAAPTRSVQNDPSALVLVAVGDPRALPEKVLGASAEPMIEHLLDDPHKAEAIKGTAPAIVRFPGGSQANYYNWRTGLPKFDPRPNSSAYYKFWADAGPKIARAFPGGISQEQYASFAAYLGADVMLVPNLETSSVDEQAAWFKQLAADSALPNEIELGNEFWIAMGGDPNVMRVWPDLKTSQAVMQRYAQTLRPIAGPRAKFAVEAAAASFTVALTDTRPFSRRLLQWDQDLAPAAWFDAVTVHLYPPLAEIAANAGGTSPDAVFPLLMGRADAGVDRALDDVAQRVPGKEIWVSEWNPRGAATDDRANYVTPAMKAHLVARTELAMLRHPAMTKALYFTLNMADGSPFQAYLPRGDKYVPLAETAVVGWFDDAANGGSTFQRVIDSNDRPLGGLGPFAESYRPIEGGLFRSGARTVLIVQNASGETRTLDPQQMAATTRPARAEVLAAGDLANPVRAAAAVTAADTTRSLTLPPYSIARVIWK